MFFLFPVLVFAFRGMFTRHTTTGVFGTSNDARLSVKFDGCFADAQERIMKQVSRCAKLVDGDMHQHCQNFIQQQLLHAQDRTSPDFFEYTYLMLNDLCLLEIRNLERLKVLQTAINL